MRRNSPFLSFIQVFLMLALFCLTLLVYWSEVDIETELRALKQTVDELKFKTETTQFRAAEEKPRSQFDLKLQNILTDDPYYTKTLPEILPKGFKPEGILQSAEFGKPENLNPFSGWANVSTFQGMCVPSVARNKFGFFLTMCPDLAIRIEERGDPPEYWVFLRDNVYWQPLKPSWFPSDVKLADIFLKKVKVTAHDFKFYFDALMNPYIYLEGAVALRNYYGDIKEIEVIDDLTFVVRWLKPKYVAKQYTGGLRPLPSHVFKYFANGQKIIENDNNETYRTNPIWALNFQNHWAKNIIPSCGGWLFDGMTDRSIFFVRNPDYYLPLDVLSAKSNIEIKENSDSIWQGFKEERYDTASLRPDQLVELENFLSSDAYKAQKYKVKQLEYIGRSYYYVGWNEKREMFSSKKVRQALTMAIDRKRIIRQTLNGLGMEIHGSFYPFSKANDKNIQPWPFDPLKAKKILEEEGWFDTHGTGTLEKNGIPFKFKIIYYVKNPIYKAIAEYIQSAYREINIQVELNGVDMADLTKVFEDKDFDALLMGWTLGTPPEDPKQLWYSKGALEKGSSNAIGFQNPKIDEIIDKLQLERDDKKREDLYHEFDQIIHDEQPYTFLYTPKTVLLYRDYMQNIFIPKDKIPGADVGQPDLGVSWIEK